MTSLFLYALAVSVLAPAFSEFAFSSVEAAVKFSSESSASAGTTIWSNNNSGLNA